jgi:transcriptional repressor NF-X1
MSAAEASVAPAVVANPENNARGNTRSRGRGGRGRGYHRGRGRGNNRGQARHGIPETPASTLPGADGIDNLPESLTQQTPREQSQRRPQSNRHPRQTQDSVRGGQTNQGRRGDRSSRARPNRTATTNAHDRNPTQVGGRSFGGRLTRNDEDTIEHPSPSLATAGNGTSHDDHLHADAPEFVPGQAPSHGLDSKPSSQPTKKARKPPPKITTKSTAPDLATRTHEDIANGLYECPICTSELGRKSRIWSCGLCWTVFHLSCIKKWSKNEGSAFQQRQAEDGTEAQRQWRCPGCNLPQDILPTTYSCWCEKEIDPRPLPGIPPHSCGQTCSRIRKGCPHPCDLTCHAGPCLPCTAMGPTQDCFCGKNSTTKRCVDTDYTHGWGCGEICGDLLPCGKHTCPRPCHEGFCGSCEEKVDARCYCGKIENEILCSATEEEITSELYDTASPDTSKDLETWMGSFKCGEICNRPFDCGVHFCQKQCHPQDANSPHCPRSPDVVLRCPCGKTPLSRIEGSSPRVSCEDPIPNCSEPCSKTLPCGHLCPMVCHTGPCRPCMMNVTINCRCGRNSFNTICHQSKIEPPQCFRVCKATMNCGRHTCAEHCCSGERKAIERQATKRKARPLGSAQNRAAENDIEAEHICVRRCDRLLKCGNHTCPELCHKGPCGTCREAIFDEISCHCGRSVLYPPLPCGTNPPPCRYDCERQKACNHPHTPHNCHTDDEECPKCPFLTEKVCLCGKKLLKNQPCWLTEPRCGMICGEVLKCGSHTCTKQCHRPGECEDALEPCKQACGKTKKICGHPCSEPCHAPFACSEKEPCSTMVMITCPCGRLRKEKRCNAARAVSGKGQTTQSETVPTVAPLKCDDECARLERNRTLASALKVDIDPSTTLNQNPSAPLPTSSTALPYTDETLDLYVQVSSSSTLSTLQDYEATLYSLATSATQRSVRFQPAKAPLRAFVHSLASDWGFASESFDPEPHRHVFVLKPTQWASPGLGLSGVGIRGMAVGECARIRDREQFKEREAKRLAAAEAKALRDALKATSAEGADGGGGWAQVASTRRKQLQSGSDSPSPAHLTRTNTPMAQLAARGAGTGSMYAALGLDVAPSFSNASSASKKKDGLLVLRSGVGSSKKKKAEQQEQEILADTWEEQVEREEHAEQQEKEEETRRSSEESERPELDREIPAQAQDVIVNSLE